MLINVFSWQIAISAALSCCYVTVNYTYWILLHVRFSIFSIAYNCNHYHECTLGIMIISIVYVMIQIHDNMEYYIVHRKLLFASYSTPPCADVCYIAADGHDAAADADIYHSGRGGGDGDEYFTERCSGHDGRGWSVRQCVTTVCSRQQPAKQQRQTAVTDYLKSKQLLLFGIV